MNQYLQTLWRSKAGLIAGVGIGAILTAVIAAAIMSGDRQSQSTRVERTTADQTTANAQITEEEVPSPSFGKTEIVDGTNYVILPLFTAEANQQEYNISSQRNQSFNQKNHLFIDLESDRHQWLFFTHEQLITEYQKIYEEEPSANESESESEELNTVAILYNIVETDTNNDEQLTPQDEFTIAISKPNGREYTIIDTGVEQILDQIRTEDELAIIYLKNNEPYLAKFSLDTYDLDSTELPPALIK